MIIIIITFICGAVVGSILSLFIISTNKYERETKCYEEGFKAGIKKEGESNKK